MMGRDLHVSKLSSKQGTERPTFGFRRKQKNVVKLSCAMQEQRKLLTLRRFEGKLIASS